MNSVQCYNFCFSSAMVPTGQVALTGAIGNQKQLSKMVAADLLMQDPACMLILMASDLSNPLTLLG